MFRIFLPAAFILLLISCEYTSLEEYAHPAYDGQLNWTEVTKKAAWPERYDHAALAFDNKLWIFGGYNPGQVRGDTYYEDIWNSADGITWERVSNSAPWLGRRGHRVVVFDDGSGPIRKVFPMRLRPYKTMSSEYFEFKASSRICFSDSLPINFLITHYIWPNILKTFIFWPLISHSKFFKQRIPV